MKDYSKIRCIVQAIGDLVEAQEEERKAREDYDGPSWGYYGQRLFENIDKAAEELSNRLDEYIDERVKMTLRGLCKHANGPTCPQCADNQSGDGK